MPMASARADIRRIGQHRAPGAVIEQPFALIAARGLQAPVHQALGAQMAGLRLVHGHEEVLGAGREGQEEAERDSVGAWSCHCYI